MTTNGATYAVTTVLPISILIVDNIKFSLDPVAERAFRLTTESKFQGAANAALQRINTGGLTTDINNLSNQLRATGLNDIQQLLLSNPNIYGAIILTALNEIHSTDTLGLVNFVLQALTGEPSINFYANLLEIVLSERSITPTPAQQGRLAQLILQKGISLRAGQVVPAIQQMLDTITTEGNIPAYVDEYINKREITAAAFTPEVRQAMIDYLLKIGVTIDPNKWNEDENDIGKRYDEYFALAYNEALRISAGMDPIDGINGAGQISSWNFEVDLFTTLEAQGVSPKNVKAAGALDYVYYIGEQLQVFNVANALVLRWASGALDITEGATASMLYRFYKLRRRRATAEERGMLYKRVFNRGDARLLSQMAVNRAFAKYWHTLMAEFAEYIRKSESTSSSDNQVSTAPIYQATKTLQYNLTEYMTGMAHLQVTEDYAHLQEALDIIRSEDILDHFGGRRKSMWGVIERVAQEDLGVMLQTAAIRTLAVEGNKIFQWIANFNEGLVNNAEFSQAQQAAEAWILARASLDEKQSPRLPAYTDQGNGRNQGYENDFDEFENEFRELEDEFNDWEL